MPTQFESILENSTQKLKEIGTLESLVDLEKQLFDKDSEFAKLSKTISLIHPAQRKEFGQNLNDVKAKIISSINEKREILRNELYSLLDSEKKDVTYFQKNDENAWLNPITTNTWELEDIFLRMGFDIVYPYEVDTYENVFEYVNIPKGHPAADSWDTFYLNDGHIPITHTSSMQNRILKKFSKKIDLNNPNDFHAAIIPGRCFRNEATDGRHEHTFYQLEGVVIGKGIKFSDMLGTLKTAFEEYFQKSIEIRVIPDYFPFVEPGNGVEIRWENPDERILKITHGTGWLEVLGCGMIHPNVLKMGGIDSEAYTGFAWGVGIERLFMIKSGVEDLRLFHSGKKEFLEQFMI